MSNQATGDHIQNLRRAWMAAHLVPLWESPTAHKPPAPPAAVHLWAWQTIRPLVEGAIDLANPAAVERRVLSLVNPGSKSVEDEATSLTWRVGSFLSAICSSGSEAISGVSSRGRLVSPPANSRDEKPWHSAPQIRVAPR